MTVPEPLFVSLIPNLMQGEGHIIPYHRAVQTAVTPLGWDYQAWIPPQTSGTEINLQDLAALNAIPRLSPLDLEAEGKGLQKLARIPQALQWGSQLAQALQILRVETDSTHQPIILFMERFVHWQLLGVWWGLCRSPKELRGRLHLWLLYRRDVHNDRSLLIYQGLHQQIFRCLPRAHCQFFTDSEPLRRSLQQVFQVKLTVMPIPHTDFPTTTPLATMPDPIICWWPGSPREEKGWSILRQLTQIKAPNTPQIELVAASAAKLSPAPQSINVTLVGDRLSREAYADWLKRSHIILLPYDSMAYRERTSGIFTEAIIAGRMPLVTVKTWMAEELENFQLSDLAMDWSDTASFWQQLPDLLRNAIIQQRLRAMQKAYCEFHCLDNYRQIFQQQKL